MPEILEQVIEDWRERLSHCIGIMDERGRSNPENNSQMLWDSEWKEIREELYHLLTALNYYHDRAHNNT